MLRPFGSKIPAQCEGRHYRNGRCRECYTDRRQAAEARAIVQRQLRAQSGNGSSRDRKVELIAEARAAGWTGKSYRKAKRYDRMLTRLQREAFVAPVESVGAKVRRHVGRLIKRGGK
jgi:hypothetical protein